MVDISIAGVETKVSSGARALVASGRVGTRACLRRRQVASAGTPARISTTTRTGREADGARVGARRR